MRFAVPSVSLALAFLSVSPVHPAAPAYLAPSALAAEMASVGPNPFLWAPEAVEPSPPSAAPEVPVPEQIGHLSLRRPYTVVLEVASGAARTTPPWKPGPAPGRMAVETGNPFAAPATEAPAMPPPGGPAAGTERPWTLSPDNGAWDLVEAAWKTDPVAVRRMFRTATEMDWPLDTGSGPRAEAVRARVARWVRETWTASARARASETVRRAGLSGPTALEAEVNGALSFLAGAAPRFRPVVTGDPRVNRYGAGFLTRLSADLGESIPWPAVDLSRFDAASIGWARATLDEIARHGIRGLTVRLPEDAAARTKVLDALEPLGTANTYLPPPSEVGVLVCPDAAAHESGAWVALFRAWAALRESGVWADFVSDEQLAAGDVALERFKVLVVPAARWTRREAVREIRAWTVAGGILVAADRHAFSRAEDGADTSAAALALLGWANAGPPQGDERNARVAPAPGTQVLRKSPSGSAALTERRLGRGRVLAFTASLEPDNGFWETLRKDAGIPSRPWLDSVTIANLERVVGRYQAPGGSP